MHQALGIYGPPKRPAQHASMRSRSCTQPCSLCIQDAVNMNCLLEVSSRCRCENIHATGAT
eukprot:12975526-Alexandrium_andersonii.AAC.1